MKKFLGIVLIIIGCVFIFIKPITAKNINHSSMESRELFNDLDIDDIKENMNKESDFDFDIIEEIQPTGTFRRISNVDKDHIIGQLVLPDSKINLILYNGINNHKLRYGVGTMKPNQVMGEGNYAIAGHYGINGELFHNLDHAEIGDEIRLTDKENIYIYRVYEKVVVDESQVQLIEDSQALKMDNPIISLMCCYYEDNVSTGDRLFVKGSLEKTIPYTAIDMLSVNK